MVSGIFLSASKLGNKRRYKKGGKPFTIWVCQPEIALNLTIEEDCSATNEKDKLKSFIEKDYKIVSSSVKKILYRKQKIKYVIQGNMTIIRLFSRKEGLGLKHRHGICHGCTDIIRVKFVFTGVKCSCEHTLFVVNSLPVALLCCFW